ncbi:MAG: hypothetical protein ACRCU0_07090 [Candidatus Rhabdochlamydia sp.]
MIHDIEQRKELLVHIPNRTQSTTIRKTAFIVGAIISAGIAGIGIGYLIASKTIKKDSLENPESTIDESQDFWSNCCRPLFQLIGCLHKQRIPHFSDYLRQCPTSESCDP